MYIGGRVWEILAADVVAALTVFVGNVDISHLEFTDYTAAGDTAKVRDINGKTIWDAHGAADLEEVRSGSRVGWANGITIPAGGITSGRVLIYIK